MIFLSIAIKLALLLNHFCSLESHKSINRVGIVTSFYGPRDPEYVSRFKWATKTKICYVTNFINYKFILYTGPFNFLPKNASANEAKPYVLRKFLPYFDWVMWMDADTFFQQFRSPLDPFFLKYADIVVQDFYDEYSANNGVFFIRKSVNGLKFLNIWIDMLENFCGNHEWAYFDQNAWLETIMIMLNETRVIQSSIPYNNECRAYPKGCTKNAKCYVGWWEKLGHRYEARNDLGNHSIQFWHMPKYPISPYHAFGYFHSWGLYKDNQCLETDIICHTRPTKPYYKIMEKKMNFSEFCPFANFNYTMYLPTMYFPTM